MSRFEILVEDETVPGLLWLPLETPAPHPLVLAGHGFTLDKRYPFPLQSVRSLVLEYGCAVAILDAPEHGDRRPSADQAAEMTARAYQEYWRRNAGARIAREYEAARRSLQQRPEIAAGPVGYWGLSLATQYGLAYLSSSTDIAAAVLGLFRLGSVVAHYASRVRCPVFFIQQLGDEIHPAELVTPLFEAIASPDKHLAASPGKHTEVPDEVARRAVAFLVERLVRGVVKR